MYDDAAGTTLVKIKGSGSIGDDVTLTAITDLEPLDAMDLVRPSMEENAFFLITAMAITPNQTQDVCDGNPNETPSCSAHDASNCSQEFYSWNSQGIWLIHSLFHCHSFYGE